MASWESYLQRPFVQIKPHSQVPGVRIWTYFGGQPFTPLQCSHLLSLYLPMGSSQVFVRWLERNNVWFLFQSLTLPCCATCILSLGSVSSSVRWESQTSQWSQRQKPAESERKWRTEEASEKNKGTYANHLSDCSEIALSLSLVISLFSCTFVYFHNLLSISFVADSVCGSETVERSKAASFSRRPRPLQERLTHNQIDCGPVWKCYSQGVYIRERGSAGAQLWGASGHRCKESLHGGDTSAGSWGLNKFHHLSKITDNSTCRVIKTSKNAET